ncbi:MAG: serine acetyltransferase [Kiritimatiellae bacterium]|nr:serine acetyltransferase [Kiritimatiellia bacterium]
MQLSTHSLATVSLPPEAFRFRCGLLLKLETDVKARCVWYRGQYTRAGALRSCLYEGFLSTVCLRVAEACAACRPTRPIAWFVLRLLKMFCHMTIGCGATFGPGLVLLHPFGLFIHKSVRAGRNLVLQNSITLGGEDDRGPQIGDNVFIGVGARVIGPVRLGDGCRVAANAVVMASIRDHHVAAGNPARQIPVIGPSAVTSGDHDGSEASQ